jgi:membrane fusion protein (multidrug efflux system)
MRSLLIICAVAAVIAGVLFGLPGGDRAAKLEPVEESSPAVPVTTYQLQLQSFQSQIRALGTLRAWESVDITSSVSETIVSLHFEDGGRAAQGDLLVTLKQDEEQASLREQQELLREQEREVRRLVDLASRNQVAQTDLDQRRTLAAIARNRIEQMHARIEDRNIHAPFAGVLGLRQVSPGALVAPGQMITTLDDISRMRLDFTVPALSLGFLQQGQQVEATTAAFVRSFTGTLSAVDTRVDPVTRSVTARAVFDNPEGILKPGMLMTVIVVGKLRQSLLVPEESLIASGSDHFVWRLQGSDAQRVAIQVGERRPGWVEVTAGLSAGDVIVRDGVARLRGMQAEIERVTQ